MKATTQITISGFLVGTIWMPAAECWKELDYDVTREAARKDGATFRDHVTDIISDGDFQRCDIAAGELIVTTTKTEGATRVRRTRVFPLSMFPSIADCLHPDPDWMPVFDEDFEDT